MGLVRAGHGVTNTTGDDGAGNVVFNGYVSFVMLKATVSGVVIIKDAEFNSNEIAIDAGSHMYDVFPVDCSGIKVKSGTIDYVAIG